MPTTQLVSPAEAWGNKKEGAMRIDALASAPGLRAMQHEAEPAALVKPRRALPPGECREALPAYGPEVVGRSLRLLGSAERLAVVDQFDPVNGQHRLTAAPADSSAGAVEWVRLGAVRFVWASEPAAGSAPAALSGPTGEAAVGRQLRLWHTAERSWRSGVVTGYDAASGRHQVQHEDGQGSEYQLGHEVVMWVGGQGDAPALQQLQAAAGVEQQRAEQAEQQASGGCGHDAPAASPAPMAESPPANAAPSEAAFAEEAVAAAAPEAAQAGAAAAAAAAAAATLVPPEGATEGGVGDKERTGAEAAAAADAPPAPAAPAAAAAAPAAAAAAAPARPPGRVLRSTASRTLSAVPLAGKAPAAGAPAPAAPGQGQGQAASQPAAGPAVQAAEAAAQDASAPAASAAAPGVGGAEAASKRPRRAAAAAASAAPAAKPAREASPAAAAAAQPGAPSEPAASAAAAQPPAAVQPQPGAPAPAPAPTPTPTRAARAAGTAAISPPRPPLQLPLPDAGVLVGSRIGVWWDGDDTYYRGRITQVDAAVPGRYQLRYDDGEVEWLQLNGEKARWVTPRGRTAGLTPRVLGTMAALGCFLHLPAAGQQAAGAGAAAGAAAAVPPPAAPPPVPEGEVPGEAPRSWGAEAVGRRLSVYGAGDGTWHLAEVLNFSARNGRHHLLYADGEDEWVELREEAVAWWADQPGRPPAAVGVIQGQPLPEGESAVGWRVAVYWRLDQTLYEGRVMSYDAATARHIVLYDDGEYGEVDLGVDRVVWRQEPSSDSSSEEDGSEAGEEGEGEEGNGADSDDEAEELGAKEGGRRGARSRRGAGGRAGQGQAAAQRGGGSQPGRRQGQAARGPAAAAAARGLGAGLAGLSGGLGSAVFVEDDDDLFFSSSDDDVVMDDDDEEYDGASEGLTHGSRGGRGRGGAGGGGAAQKRKRVQAAGPAPKQARRGRPRKNPEATRGGQGHHSRSRSAEPLPPQQHSARLLPSQYDAVPYEHDAAYGGRPGPVLPPLSSSAAAAAAAQGCHGGYPAASYPPYLDPAQQQHLQPQRQPYYYPPAQAHPHALLAEDMDLDGGVAVANAFTPSPGSAFGCDVNSPFTAAGGPWQAGPPRDPRVSYSGAPSQRAGYASGCVSASDGGAATALAPPAPPAPARPRTPEEDALAQQLLAKLQRRMRVLQLFANRLAVAEASMGLAPPPPPEVMQSIGIAAGPLPYYPVQPSRPAGAGGAASQSAAGTAGSGVRVMLSAVAARRTLPPPTAVGARQPSGDAAAASALMPPPSTVPSAAQRAAAVAAAAASGGPGVTSPRLPPMAGMSAGLPPVAVAGAAGGSSR